jgi:lipopolysaccharide/colanic/teichoic acid biosynthesis glycosyltransferase
MKLAAKFWVSLFERVFAGVLIILILPPLLFLYLLLTLVGGSPVLVKDHFSKGSCYRFRTTGHGTSDFHSVGRFLRQYALDDLPGLWSIVLGDIRMTDFRRLLDEKRRI